LDKGFCAFQNQYFYGYKLHGVCGPSCFIQIFDLGKATINNIDYLKEVKHPFKRCIIIGNCGYISRDLRVKLWQESLICIEVAQHNNRKNRNPVL
jgi:hypothetical protein